MSASANVRWSQYHQHSSWQAKTKFNYRVPGKSEEQQVVLSNRYDAWIWNTFLVIQGCNIHRSILHWTRRRWALHLTLLIESVIMNRLQDAQEYAPFTMWFAMSYFSYVQHTCKLPTQATGRTKKFERHELVEFWSDSLQAYSALVSTTIRASCLKSLVTSNNSHPSPTCFRRTMGDDFTVVEGVVYGKDTPFFTEPSIEW